MAKFGINDILNAKTKAAGQQAQTEGYKEIYLSPYEVKAAQENTHQKLENIEELADSFLHVGQEQPTVLARVNGEYRIIDGHRRNAANILNLERGHKEYEKVLYRFMDMSEAMYELRLLAGNGYTQELTAYEKTRLVERTKAALIRAKEEDVCRGEALPKEYRADAVSKSTDVGAVIPTTVLNQIVEKLESTGMILALVTRTAYKGGVSIPVSTVKPTATWVNEGAGSDKQKKNIAKDGMITFAYHKLRCAVAVSLEVDTMAISAFETLLINNIVEAMTKALEQAIIDGNGTGKPKGILAETPADGQTIESAAPSYSDLIKAEGALPMAYENGAVWCMSKKTFMEYVGMTDKNGQPIAKVNYGTSGKPERTLLGRTVVLCDYVASYSAALTKDTIFAFLFNFKDYVLNTNYSMGVKKYEDNDTDDQITKGIMLVDGKVVDKNSLVVVKKIEAV